MKIRNLHGWQVSTAEARDIQQKLAEKIIRHGDVIRPRFLAGIDVSVNRFRNTAAAAVVVIGYPDLEVVEVQTSQDVPCFPYVPGLLSFREAPLVLEACKKLERTPDLIVVDGQGLAHPRRIGLACHLGLLLDTPAIGCAKSRLCGEHDEPGHEAGNYAELVDGGEVIGAVLRTRTGVKPVYVSTGHRIGLAEAIAWIQRTGRGYRLPEPTRLAHLAAGGHLVLKDTITV
jgi:deoxyribonuclease V